MLFQYYTDKSEKDDPRKQIAKGQNILMFNYRNTGGSTGKPTSYKDLVIDGLAQIDYLLSQGVKPENITLYGHSLGGAVATEVAAHMHAQDKPAGRLFVDRSFTRISDVIPSLKFITKPLLYMAGWNFNPINAMKRMDGGTTQTTVIEYAAQEDELIGKNASYTAARNRGEIVTGENTGREILHVHNTNNDDNLHGQSIAGKHIRVVANSKPTQQTALQEITSRITNARASSVAPASDHKSVQ